MTPIEGSKKINERKIQQIYNFKNTNKIAKFKMGDPVRISLEKIFLKKAMRLIGQKRYLLFMI